jgi:prepilin-type N-terminal cleavage/methylation domain-containing protein
MKTDGSGLNHVEFRVAYWNRVEGFTLIELLGVVIIIGILSMLLLGLFQKVRLEGNAAQSVANLRSLQMANELYATDNNGYYLADWLLDENWVQKDYWMFNPEFHALLGYPNNPPGSYPPPMRSGFKSNLVYAPSIGMNMNSHNPYENVRPKRTAMANPSALISFAESPNFQLVYAHRHDWDPKNDYWTGKSDIAYRYKGKCIAVTYGGNVIMITPEESDDKAHWFPSVDLYP